MLNVLSRAPASFLFASGTLASIKHHEWNGTERVPLKGSDLQGCALEMRFA